MERKRRFGRFSRGNDYFLGDGVESGAGDRKRVRERRNIGKETLLMARKRFVYYTFIVRKADRARTARYFDRKRTGLCHEKPHEQSAEYDEEAKYDKNSKKAIGHNGKQK